MGDARTSQTLSPTDSEPKPLKLWIVVVGMCIGWFTFSGFFLLLPPRFQKVAFAPWLVLALVIGPFVGMILSRRMRRTSEYPLSGIVLAWLWLLIPAGCEVIWKSGYSGLMFLWLPPLNFVVAIAATVNLTKPSRRRRTAMKAFAVGMFLGLAVYALALDAYAVERLSSRPVEVALLRIDKCALEFAAVHSLDGFPQSLQQLGPAGTHCITQELAEGRHAGFTFNYSPRRPSINRAISGYLVFARPPLLGGWLSERPPIYSDESGLVFGLSPEASDQGPTQMKRYLWSDQLIPPVFWDARACVSASYRYSSPEISTEKYVSDACLRKYDWVDGQPPRVLGDHFVYEYEPRLDESGLLTGFTLQARPREYGLTAIRSYLFVVRALPGRPNGPAGRYIVHVTAQNRPATEADPVAFECEIGAGRNCDVPATFNK